MFTQTMALSEVAISSREVPLNCHSELSPLTAFKSKRGDKDRWSMLFPVLVAMNWKEILSFGMAEISAEPFNCRSHRWSGRAWIMTSILSSTLVSMVEPNVNLKWIGTLAGISAERLTLTGT